MTEKRKNKNTKLIDVPVKYNTDFMAEMDGRVEVARTLRERLAAYYSDLGGQANLSRMEQSICKRIVHVERWAEKTELTMAHGGTVDIHAYFVSVNVLSGLLSKIGLRRRAKLLPSLNDYLNANKQPPLPPAQPSPPQDTPSSQPSNQEDPS